MVAIDSRQIAQVVDRLQSADSRLLDAANRCNQLQNELQTLQQAYGRQTEYSQRPDNRYSDSSREGDAVRREQIGSQVSRVQSALQQAESHRHNAQREQTEAQGQVRKLLEQVEGAVRAVDQNIQSLSQQSGRPQQWLSANLRVEHGERQRLEQLRAQLLQALRTSDRARPGPPQRSGHSGLESMVGSSAWNSGPALSSAPAYFSADRVYARTPSYSLDTQLKSNPYHSHGRSQADDSSSRLEEAIRDDHYRRHWDWNHPMNAHKREVMSGTMQSDWRQPTPNGSDLSLRYGVPGSYGPMIPGPSSFDVMTMNIVNRLGRFF